MTVSIIIAVATWQENLQRCVRECLALDDPDFEIIILPDADIPGEVFAAAGIALAGRHPIKVISTGRVSPGTKRDIGLKAAQGEIIAFIDDDAYPAKDWLSRAVEDFSDQSVAAVGGPAVTPLEDTLLQKVSGLIYSSWLVSGAYLYRYLPRSKRLVDDFPSCNLLVRRETLRQLGGFKTSFWPGEDTKLCLEITHNLDKKILYDPQVLVYHHRRKVLFPHLRQVASYALHRGYFVKKFPQTSSRLAYFIPSIFVFYLILGGLFGIFSPRIGEIFTLTLGIYCAIVLISSISQSFQKDAPVAKLLPKVSLIPLSFIGIIATHLTYGLYFIFGILSRKLKEEL